MPERGSISHAVAATFVVLLAGVLAPEVFAKTPEQVPGLLMGGAGALATSREFVAAPVDPGLPRGARIIAAPRPDAAVTRCSMRHPVCAHWVTAADTEQLQVAATLRALEHAYERAVVVLGLPAPLSDGALGGGPELDLYALKAGSAPYPDSARLDPALLATDSASAFCTYSGRVVSEQVALRCVAGAIAARLDAAESPATRDAYAGAIAALLAPRTSVDHDALGAWQANPQLATVGREVNSTSRATATWFEFLDSKYGTGEPAALISALLGVSRGTTADAHPEWSNAPDLLDALRRSFGDDAKQFAQLWREFAVQRATWGRPESTRPDLDPLPPDWTLDYSSLPRRVAGPRALEPLGSGVVEVKLDDVPLGVRLGLAVEWEEPGAFVWTVLALDRDGVQVNRWDLPYLEKGHRLEQTLMNFESAARLLIIGTNLGGIDLRHPFDPDHEPWEPHAYTVHLVSLF